MRLSTGNVLPALVQKGGFLSGQVVREKEITMTAALKIIPDQCTGCMQCELACSWSKTGQFQPSASLIRVHIFDEEAAYAPYTCLQCEEAWCMTVCPTNAIVDDASTGAKRVVQALCIGCHLCTLACPFGTVFTQPSDGQARKCDLCEGEPACAAACPTQAIQFAPLTRSGEWFDEWGQTVARRHEEALQ